jgi:hypothetical protein
MLLISTAPPRASDMSDTSCRSLLGLLGDRTTPAPTALSSTPAAHEVRELAEWLTEHDAPCAEHLAAIWRVLERLATVVRVEQLDNIALGLELERVRAELIVRGLLPCSSTAAVAALHHVSGARAPLT